jgi:hypothetical protein
MTFTVFMWRAVVNAADKDLRLCSQKLATEQCCLNPHVSKMSETAIFSAEKWLF